MKIIPNENSSDGESSSNRIVFHINSFKNIHIIWFFEVIDVKTAFIETFTNPATSFHTIIYSYYINLASFSRAITLIFFSWHTAISWDDIEKLETVQLFCRSHSFSTSPFSLQKKPSKCAMRGDKKRAVFFYAIRKITNKCSLVTFFDQHKILTARDTQMFPYSRKLRRSQIRHLLEHITP